jgi:hypothetical protein
MVRMKARRRGVRMLRCLEIDGLGSVVVSQMDMIQFKGIPVCNSTSTVEKA